MLLKQLVQRIAPNLYHTLRWRYGHPANYQRVKSAVLEKYGSKVIQGPFQGMKYVDNAAGSAFIPKLLGTYESELHSLIEQAMDEHYDTIIDVGCAEGYYAVGLALHSPSTTVYAYDTDPDARALCRKLAALNSVESRVSVGELCDIECLRTLPLKDTLLICDCEGYEEELLQPASVPHLAECDILVELHDALRPGLTPRILKRFKNTHSIELIDAQMRTSREYATVQFLSKADQALALTESRFEGQQWAFLKAKRDAS